MEKTVHCKCKTGCKNRRCICARNDEPCGDECECVDCRNPLNPEEIEYEIDQVMVAISITNSEGEEIILLSREMFMNARESGHFRIGGKWMRKKRVRKIG